MWPPPPIHSESGTMRKMRPAKQSDDDAKAPLLKCIWLPTVFLSKHLIRAGQCVIVPVVILSGLFDPVHFEINKCISTHNAKDINKQIHLMHWERWECLSSFSGHFSFLMGQSFRPLWLCFFVVKALGDNCWLLRNGTITTGLAIVCASELENSNKNVHSVIQGIVLTDLQTYLLGLLWEIRFIYLHSQAGTKTWPLFCYHLIP